jgi:hypothetical protein
MLDDFKFHADVEWMRELGIRGVVIGKHVCFAEPADQIPDWLFLHELEHAYQLARHGWLKFTILYFYYRLRHGYLDNPFEIEARIAQTRNLTAYEEELLWKLREGSMPLPKPLAPKPNP